MKRVVSPLKLRMKRSQVADLHQALSFLSFPVAEVERDAQRFGVSTRDAVRQLQARYLSEIRGDHQLAVTGEVDESTAILLNHLLAEHGVLDTEVSYQVTGIVRSSDDQPAPGLTVQAFDRDVSQTELLGVAVTNPQGAYRISFNEAAFRRTLAERGGPELFIRVLDAGGKELGHSKTVNNAPREITLDLALAETSISHCVVRGRVTTSNGQSVPEYLVKVFDHNVGIEDTLLNQATTDTHGQYSIPYALDQLQGKLNADLVVSLYANSEDAPLQTAEEKINAGADTVQDFRLSVPTEPVTPEIVRLSTQIKPLLRGPSRLATLDSQQIAFLSRKTGLDADKVGRLSQSDQLADGNTNLACFYYALMADGQTVEPQAILDRERADILHTVQNATVQNFIPALSEVDLDYILDVELPKRRGLNLLRPTVAGQKASLGELLDTLPLSEKLNEVERLAFAIRFGEHGHTAPLWDATNSAGYTTRVAALKRTLALDEVTEGHGTLIAALQEQRETAAPASIAYLAKLARRDWLELALAHGAPPANSLSAVEYGFELERTVEQHFPMATLRERLVSGDIRINNFPTEAVVNVLTEHPDFDPGTESVDAYLARVGRKTEELSSALRSLQRVLPLSGALHVSAALLNAGLDSALAISRAGSSVVAACLSSEMDVDAARALHTKARDVTMTNTALVARYSPLYNQHAIPSIPFMKTGETLLAKYPDLRVLFGDQDYCACRHCQSVLSPAAYLTDLLHFLQTSSSYINTPFGSAAKPFLGLSVRRPDLINLLLTCENTNIEIPSVDLVLEVLENTVALPMIIKVETSQSAKIVEALENNEVPQDIRDVLAQTAITIGRHLSVTPVQEGLSWDLLASITARNGMGGRMISYLGSIAPLKLVRIDDDARRWIAGYVPKLLFASHDHSALVLATIDTFDVEAAESDMQQGCPPRQLLNDFADKYGLPCVATVESIPDTVGSYWPIAVAGEISVSVELSLVLPKILVAGFTPKVVLLAPDGQLLRSVDVSRGSLKTIEDWLNGRLQGDLYQRAVMAILQLPDLEWEKTWDETNGQWQLHYAFSTIQLYITEAILGIFSLTYRSSSVQTDLVAVPENRNPSSYKILREAVFPWSLPLDLPTEEIRVYLNELGVPRLRLMEIAGASPTAGAYSGEILGLSIADEKILEQYRYAPAVGWGLTKAKWLVDLQNLSAIMSQSGLSFRELLDLRQTGAGAVIWTPITPQGECHPSKMQWADIDDDQLAWIHNLTHLTRKTNWPLRELNVLLAAFRIRKRLTLAPLALAARLHTRLKLPLPYVAAMLGYLETTPWVDHVKEGEPSSPSLYETHFQRSVLRPSPSFSSFTLDSKNMELTSTSKTTLTEHAKFLAVALGLKELDVEILLHEFLIGRKSNVGLRCADQLSLANLTLLLGITVYGHSLQLSAAELLRWVRHLGNPFKLTSAIRRAEALLVFADQLEFARQSGTSLDELDYLLRHDLHGPFADAATRLRIGLAGLRDALQKGTLLSNISLDNLNVQLSKLGASDTLLMAIRDEAGATSVLKTEIVIASPPDPLPDLPANLQGRFHYRRDEQRGTVWLGCCGIVSDDDFAKLPAGGIRTSGAALMNRYKLIRSLLSSQLQVLCRNDDTSASPLFPILVAKPAITDSGVVVPEDLQSLLRIESIGGVRRLKLHALIAKDQVDEIKSMVPGLTDQIEDLRAQSDSVHTSGILFLDADKADALLAAKTGKLVREILERLVPVLEIDLLTMQLATLMSSETTIINCLLDIIKLNHAAGASSALALLTAPDLLDSDAAKRIEPGHFADQVDVLFKLDKAARLVRDSRLTVDQLGWLCEGGFDVLRLNDLSIGKKSSLDFAHWRALVELMRFRDSVAGGAATVKVLVARLGNASVKRSDVELLLAEAYALNQEQVAAAADQLRLNMQALRKPANLLRLIELLHLLKLLGTTVETIQGLVTDAPELEHAMAARKLFMAQFDAESLPKRLQPISDKLRVRQRDALVAYLKWRDKLPDENALLDYFLIDVKMEPCMRTSRIKQAISSVQLYIQRCLLNLESQSPYSVVPSDMNSTHLYWMKNYRVWEANRKVFLYPENWIEPDLRDDKTEIFRTLESDLQQENLDCETALDAFRDYLERAADIARLRVVAMWRDLPCGNLVNEILARDCAVQSKYYHRQLTITGAELTWTPWESIEGTIDSEHIFIFKLAGFLHLAFAEITVDGHNWKVGFVVRRKTKKGWSQPYKSKEHDVLRLPIIPNKNEAQTFVFRLFGPRADQDRECMDITGEVIKAEDDYVFAPREGELAVTRPYVIGEAQRLHASLRVLEKFTDQYGHTVYAKPSARKWTARIEVLIKHITIGPVGLEIPLVLRKEVDDAIAFSDSLDLLLEFGIPPEMTTQFRVPSIVIRVFGDSGVHEEHAVSLELDTQDMGRGSIQRDLVFTIKKGVTYPALAPDRSVTFASISRKFVVHDDLSISSTIDDLIISAAELEPPSKNAEHYRSGFRQIKTLEEATKELAIAEAKAEAAAKTEQAARYAATNVIAIAQANLSRAKAEKNWAVQELEGPKRKAEAAYKAVTIDTPFGRVPLPIPGAPEIAGAAKLLLSIIETLIKAADSIDVETLKKAKEIAEKTAALVKIVGIVPGLGDLALAAALVLDVVTSLAEKINTVKEAEKVLQDAEGKAAIAQDNLTEAVRLSALAKEEVERKDAAKRAAKDTSVADYLTCSTGKYFMPSTQPRPRRWSVSDAYSDDRFQLYFLWHEGKQRILAEGQAWLYAGLRQLPLPLDPGTSVALLPETFQTLGAGELPLPNDPLSIPLAYPLGKDSPKDLRVCFSSERPSSIYDWEAVFHAPLLIAMQLSAAQRFEDARRWFHTIFDPTTNDQSDASKRYWRFPPLREAGQGQGIEHFLERLAQDAAESEEDRQKLDALRAEIAAWKGEPFNPHLIARSRIRAYQWSVFIKYLDNLIAWGDQLFRRDTIETINEATQLYVLAAHLLGPRPASVPRCQAYPRSYLELAYEQSNGQDDFSNAWVVLEDLGGAAAQQSYSHEFLPDLPQGLYFCIPANSEIEALWNKVEERLFNIRHCRNIEGIERKLPLFEPPIDPALLVKAAAAGLDIGTVLTDLAAPLPLYRFTTMLQKAIEACNELKSLGAALLLAHEKKDAEALALNRSEYELLLLELGNAIREKQIEEATATQEGLKESRKTIEERYRHYQLLLGRNEINVPQPGGSASFEPVSLNLAKSGLDADSAGLGISQTELAQLSLLRSGQQKALASGISSTTAGVLFAIGGALSSMPRGSSPGPSLGDMGGPLTGAGHAASAIAGYLNTLSGLANSEAGMKGIIVGYERRRVDWIFQSNLALRELQQIDKLIAAAEIRTAIANRELENLKKQTDNLRAIDEFMKSKFTNQELYRWMSTQLSFLYFSAYRLAYELAKRAERCLQFELGTSNSTFVNYGYWDSLKKGLLAGEQLHQDLQRLDLAYLEGNRREYEITKHISLLQLHPMSLIELRETGRCEFSIPEVLYDMDCPGHYMRRIKSVSLSIPCITGQYTGVFCTMTLLSNIVRKSTVGDYGQPALEDTVRFVYDYSRIQSVVTSSGQTDSGLFEPNLRDERYLPFEGAGAISSWRLELSAAQPQFDYQTISDVILHVRYTAREGGGQLRSGAMANLSEAIKEAIAPGSVRLFSVRYEFPSEWAKFTGQSRAGNNVSAKLHIELRQEHFPFWASGLMKKIEGISVMSKKGVTISTTAPNNITKAVLEKDPSLGNLYVENLDGGFFPADARNWPVTLEWSFDNNQLEDLWLAVTWSS